MAFSSCMYFFVTLSLFAKCAAQSYDDGDMGHDTFPTDIPTDTKEIDLYDNNIASFPDDAFYGFYQLEDLNIGKNPFTELPNLAPVGNTLKNLQMKYCKLTELDANIFNELVVLEEAYLKYCELTSFPDVPGPGSTLWKIYCNSCMLDTFPVLSSYKALEYITFGNSPALTTVPAAAVASMRLAGKLHLWGTSITSLPDYPMAYENITQLMLYTTAVSVFVVSLKHCNKL